MFNAIDRNNDGVITRAEWHHRPPPPYGPPTPSKTHCNNGHPLQPFIVPKTCGAACNVCGRTLAQGSRTMGCRRCNYDVCQDCNPQGALYCAYTSLGRRMQRPSMRSARDIIQDQILNESFWCAYCLYGGIGCLDPADHGCCLGIAECFCCAGTCRSAQCWDEDGLLAATIKIFCCLFHGEIPPSNTPGYACGPFSFGGNLYRPGTERLSPYEQEELQMLRSTLWCCFLEWCGIGFNPPTGTDPCLKAEGKACCLWTNLETDSCEHDGLVGGTAKVCCCVVDGSFPADRTPGCVSCGVTWWGRNLLPEPPWSHRPPCPPEAVPYASGHPME